MKQKTKLLHEDAMDKMNIGDIIFPEYNGTNKWYKHSVWMVKVNENLLLYLRQYDAALVLSMIIKKIGSLKSSHIK